MRDRARARVLARVCWLASVLLEGNKNIARYNAVKIYLACVCPAGPTLREC